MRVAICLAVLALVGCSGVAVDEAPLGAAGSAAESGSPPHSGSAPSDAGSAPSEAGSTVGGSSSGGTPSGGTAASAGTAGAIAGSSGSTSEAGAPAAGGSTATPAGGAAGAGTAGLGGEAPSEAGAGGQADETGEGGAAGAPAEPACECAAGACCDGCHIRPRTHFCGNVVRSTTCESGTLISDHWNLFCDGTSAGECTRWGAHTKFVAETHACE